MCPVYFLTMNCLLFIIVLLSQCVFNRCVENISNRKDNSRIIGGIESIITEYPFMVSLQYNGTFYGYDVEHFCGGAVVNEWWIVTAGKCIHRKKPGEFHARVGSKYYHKDGVIHEIEEILIHPNYVEMQWDYDVGVIKVKKPMNFDSTIQPIKLPESEYEISKDLELTVVGWGATALLGNPSSVITSNILPVISREDCAKEYGNSSVTPRMFCIYKEGYGPCVGDTGSPGLIDGTVIGLASWSQFCAYEYPTVYTDMASTVNWIKKVTSTSSATNLCLSTILAIVTIISLRTV